MNRKQRRKGLVLPPKIETRPFHVQVNVKHGVAEFIRRYKKQWHARGAIHFDLAVGQKMPPWMTVVIETLRLRRKTWRIEEFWRMGLGIRYRVTWLGFLKFTRRRR